ncbi:MAG: amidohydrolase family protein [Pseudomonadota bacterium]|jgi:aminocarboxymuconate-semialdehyde decarboxylase
MSRTPVIDVHSHVLPRNMVEAIRAQPRAYGMSVRGEGNDIALVRDDGHGSPLHPEFFDVEAKLESMDRKGIDISVISVTPVVFFYWLDGHDGIAAASLLNDGIARMVDAAPARLRGMGTLPMQDADAAIAELERIVRDLGFRSVELGCRVKGTLLSDARFEPVLRRAAELKVSVFAHPYIAGQLPTDLCAYYLGNTHGLPFDTALMAVHLMLGGTLDRLPGLDMILAHGGGHLPYQYGRLDHGYRVRPEARAHTAHSPESQLRRFHFDSLTHDSRSLAFLIDRVGADRVMIGTDAPFDMAETDPLGRLAAVDGLSASDRDRILGGNAMALLREPLGR